MIQTCSDFKITFVQEIMFVAKETERPEASVYLDTAPILYTHATYLATKLFTEYDVLWFAIMCRSVAFGQQDYNLYLRLRDTSI